MLLWITIKLHSVKADNFSTKQPETNLPPLFTVIHKSHLRSTNKPVLTMISIKQSSTSSHFKKSVLKWSTFILLLSAKDENDPVMNFALGPSEKPKFGSSTASQSNKMENHRRQRNSTGSWLIFLKEQEKIEHLLLLFFFFFKEKKIFKKDKIQTV